jgi:ABC-2 type transport system permease protein
MNPHRLRAVVRRIVAQFRRDPRTLGLIIVVPVAVLALLGWIIRDQSSPSTDVAIVNASGPAGQALVDALANSPVEGFEIASQPADEAAARQELIDRKADIAVVIPASFATDLAAGRQPAIELITLGLNPGQDGGHIGRFQLALASATKALLPPAVATRIPQFERTTVYGSPTADLLDTFAPVFVGFFAYFFVFLITGVSFLRERVGGTLERLLATPVTRGEIVVGYSVGFGIFATIQVAIVLLFTLMRIEIPAIGPLPSFTIGLDVPIAGSPLLAYVIALLLGLGAVSLGIFLSTFARTELQVIQFIPVVLVPQVFLGGILWPVETLPDVLQPVSRLLPVTYAVEGLREVIIAGEGLASRAVQVDLLALAIFATLFIVLAATTIRREVV